MVRAALFLLAASAGPAPGSKAADWANSWIVVGKDAVGAIWFVRAGDMSNAENYRPLVWISKDHSSDRSTKARMSRSLLQFDCMAGTIDVRATIGFSSKGKVLWNAKADKADPQPVARTSVAEAVLKSVCPKLAPSVH